MDFSLSFIVGIIGNIVSLLVYTSPIGTFRKIVVKKRTENYKSLPYITTLLSTILWTFYGFLKPNGLLIVTINGVGTALQLIYITLFIIFAPCHKKIKSIIAFAILDIGFTGTVIVVTLLAIPEKLRITVVGAVCAVLTIGMYASPLFALRTVIRMKSVEFMPFFLSLFMFLNAGVWSAYALLVKDYFIGVPNAIGVVLGSAQLILYAIYRNKPKPKPEPTKSMNDKPEPGEVGLGHVVIGLHEATTIDSDKVKNDGTQAKVTSPPNFKSSSTRQRSSMPKFLKTLSFGPYDINYSFSRDDHSIENSDQDEECGSPCGKD